MDRLLCYAHFDAENELKPFVKHSLRSMSQLCSGIVFVSNSPLSEADRAELSALCGVVTVQENLGYDFSMWKTALQSVDYRRYQEVVLMNSSIYGPIGPVEQVFQEMAARECDFWGLTEQCEDQPHVQSYFLVFKRQVLESRQFALFWDSVLPYRDKRQIILNYELGLSVWLREAGFRMDAFRNLPLFSRLIFGTGKRVRRKDDISLKYAVRLLESGSPFLKVAPVKQGSISRQSVADLLTRHQYPVEYLSEQLPAPTCPLCGGPAKLARRVKNFYDLHDGEGYQYRRCQSSQCGVLWLPTPSGLPRQRSGSSCGDGSEVPAARKGSRVARGIFAAMRLCGLLGNRQHFSLFGLESSAPGRLVEIGPGRGERLRALSSLGWEVTGVAADVDDCLVEELGRANIKLIPEARAAELPAGHFDAVLVSGLAGSAGDAKLLLQRCFELLKPGGSIYLSTPNVAALAHTVFGRYWYGIGAPRQAVLFNCPALKTLLSATGFQAISVTTLSCNAEIHAMHSIDIAMDKWSPLITETRIGKEALPVLFQLASSLISSVFKGQGEELFAVAAKR